MLVKIKVSGTHKNCRPKSSRYWAVVKRCSNKRIRQQMAAVCQFRKEEADPAKWCGDYHS